MENYAHTAMICVVIFAAGFNMSDNWAITLGHHTQRKIPRAVSDKPRQKLTQPQLLN